jgi:hypothetical protein
MRGGADGVGQAVALGAVLDHRVTALMEEHEGAQLLHGLPEGTELRLVQLVVVDAVADGHALEARHAHPVLHLGDRPLDVLHRHGGARRSGRGTLTLSSASLTSRAMACVASG